MQYAVQTERLSKSYGDVLAVEAVSLRVRPGEIYGFLGLNGAGKTTTIRLLLGMIGPDAGSASLLGSKIDRGRGPWGRVGHMVESPSAYPQLSVRENLEIARRLHGVRDGSATTHVMDLLRLTPYGDRRARTLSTGNLQRLGLARALLHEPELLVLDEPANGLDPAGVVEIRELLRSLTRDRGVTVFMSSHILTEVDRLATRIGIIHKGRLIEELDAERLEALRSPRLEVRARDVDAAKRALTRAGYAVLAENGRILLSEERALSAPEEVASLLSAASTPPTRLAVEQEDLERHFMRLTRDH